MKKLSEKQDKEIVQLYMGKYRLPADTFGPMGRNLQTMMNPTLYSRSQPARQVFLSNLIISYYKRIKLND